MSNVSYRIRSSICANQSAADIQACIEGGADAVGVLVQVAHRAEDAISIAAAAKLLAGTPPYIGRYAVTHASDLSDLLLLTDDLPIDTIQLHGDVSVETTKALRAQRPTIRLIKALHIVGTELPDYESWLSCVDAFVLDSVNPAENRIGGTGLTHDWGTSATVVRECPIPVILAGGLRPSNVQAAVEQVKPWAVNVNSGVETDRMKSADLVSAFVRGANAAGIRQTS
jgi:phosphoribosylanthranilate isomerase